MFGNDTIGRRQQRRRGMYKKQPIFVYRVFDCGPCFEGIVLLVTRIRTVSYKKATSSFVCLYGLLQILLWANQSFERLWTASQKVDFAIVLELKINTKIRIDWAHEYSYLKIIKIIGLNRTSQLSMCLLNH